VAYNEEELRWIRRIDYLLEFHGVACYPDAHGKYVGEYVGGNSADE
jgi:hypothetical protein